jgi:putative transposase
MIDCIDDHRGAYGVEPICKVLPIAPSTYVDHRAKQAYPARLSARERRDAALRPTINLVFEQNLKAYGARKVPRFAQSLRDQMNREGVSVARYTVERLMRVMGLHGVIRGKVIRTTTPDKAAPCPLDHVNRQFHRIAKRNPSRIAMAPAPNWLWVSDFTYVSTRGGFDNDRLRDRRLCPTDR